MIIAYWYNESPLWSVSCTKRAKRASDDEVDVNDSDNDNDCLYRAKNPMMYFTKCTCISQQIKQSLKSLYWAYIWLIVTDKREILRIFNIDL